MTEANVTWLTQEAYDRLRAELDHLSGPARQEITNRIAQARDEGDLKENGGYHAAREEQGKTKPESTNLRKNSATSGSARHPMTVWLNLE